MKKGGEIVVKISDDFNKVIFSNGMEHFLLNGQSQDNFTWIKDKFLRRVINNGHSFYLVTSKDYDRDIDILHSEDHKFNATFDRQIEPNQLSVYDSIITNDEGDKHLGKSGIMKTLMKIGDFLYMDQIDLSIQFDENDHRDGHVSMTVDTTYMAYGFNWPYFSYATKFKKILIYNAFNPTFVQRYELPSQVSLVLKTFLTDSHDLFAIVETYDQKHEIYHIDLDSEDPRLNGPILTYSWSQVDHQILNGFHVRASSAKEKINLNKVLITYMLHGTDLWSWTGKG